MLHLRACIGNRSNSVDELGEEIILVLEVVLRKKMVPGSTQAFKTVPEFQIDKTLIRLNPDN